MKFDIYILECLMSGPVHGYEIKKAIERVSATCNDTGKKISSSLLYPALTRYERDGIITKEVVAQEGKPNRIVYSMTNEGRRFFYSYINDITEVTIHDREEFYVRLTFFDILTPAAREELLSGRAALLNASIDYTKGTVIPALQANKYKIDINEFYISLTELELKHIAYFSEHINDPCKIPGEYLPRLK